MPKSEVWDVYSKNARTSIKITIWLPAVRWLRHLCLWKKMMMINLHRHKMKGKRFTLFNFNCVHFFLPGKCMDLSNCEKLLLLFCFSLILWQASHPLLFELIFNGSLLFIISLFVHRSEFASFCSFSYFCKYNRFRCRCPCKSSDRFNEARNINRI